MFSKHQRFEGIKRNYSPETVEKLRGSLKIEYTLSRRGATKLWDYLTRGGNSYINALGALTGELRSVQSCFWFPSLSFTIWRARILTPREQPLSSQIW